MIAQDKLNIDLPSLIKALGEYYDTHDHPWIDDVGKARDLLSNVLAKIEDTDPTELNQAIHDRQLCDWREGERIDG